MDETGDILAECNATPGFDNGVAYERAKVCCAVLTRRGIAIPSWLRIREIIGRGSSGDISRGVRDFRQEHAAQLRHFEAAPPGVPAQLAPLLTSLWQEALTEARKQFEGQVVHWRTLVNQAEAHVMQIDAQLLDAKSASERDHAQIALLGEKLASVDALLLTEQSARRQAEHMFSQQSADAAAQRQRLETALSENQSEMRKVLDRFDGERRHSLMQIEEARAQSAKVLAAATSEASREKSAFEMETAQLRRSIAELRSRAEHAERTLATASQEVIDLRARLSRAEADNDRVSEDNRRLMDLVKHSGTTAGQLRFRSKPTALPKKTRLTR